MTVIRTAAAAFIVAVVVLSAGGASAYAYRTARGLYRDCSAAASSAGEAPVRHERCAEYLNQMLDAWNLEIGRAHV